MGGIKVNLQVSHGLERHPDLQVFRGIGGGGRGNVVGHQQPVVFGGLVDVAVAHHAEGEAESRRHKVTPALSEGITDDGEESGECHIELVAIADRHVAHHHQSTGKHLGGLVPRLVLVAFLGSDGKFQHRLRVHLRGNLNLVLVYHLVFQLEGLAVLGLCRYDEPLAILAVRHGDSTVGKQRHFLLEGALVLGQGLLFFFLILVFVVLLIRSLGFRLCFGSRLCGCLVEALVGLLQERYLVVELLHAEGALERYLTGVRDGVAVGGSVFVGHASLPTVGGVVGGIGIHPVENGDKVQGQLIAGGEVLVVVERCSQLLDAGPH